MTAGSAKGHPQCSLSRSQLPLLAEHAGPASTTLPTIPAYSGNDMARIGKHMKIGAKCQTDGKVVRLFLSVLLSWGHCAKPNGSDRPVLTVGFDLTARSLVRLWPIATDDALTANRRFRGIADID